MLAGDAESVVPCDGCTACCRSAQFVTIGPEESDALAHVPSALLFPAPGAPAGTLLLGYDERGHCPMLVDDRCSIYDHRPRACRAYDCRVLTAAGVDLDDDGPDPAKAPIAERARRWRFRYDRPDVAGRPRRRARHRGAAPRAPGRRPAVAHAARRRRRATTSPDLDLVTHVLDIENVGDQIAERDAE